MNKFLPVDIPQVFLLTHKTHPSLRQGLFFNANERGALEERRPILTNGIVDACLAYQSTARRTEDKFYPVITPQVF